MKNLRNLTAACLVAMALTACNSTTIHSVRALAATGAPLAGAAYEISALDGIVLQTGTVGMDSYVTVDLLPDAYVLKVTDSSVNPPAVYQALLLASDFGAGGAASLNVTPISNMAYQLVVNAGINAKTDAELKTLRTRAAAVVKTALQPLLNAVGETASAEQLLTKHFVPTVDPLDKVLDSVRIECGTSSCTLTPMSDVAATALGTMTIPTHSISAAEADATTVGNQIATQKDTMLAVAPVVVVLSAVSSWGTAADSWAGYTGKFTVYNFTDYAYQGGETLYFESNKLQAQGFWSVEAQEGNGKFSLTLPSWGRLPPKQSGQPAGTFTFGFNGSGLPGSVDDLRACNFAGRRCLILVDDATVNSGAGNAGANRIRSWANFRTGNTPAQATPATPPAPTTNPEASGTGNPTSGGTGVVAGMQLMAAASWNGGFNGELLLTNEGSVDWTSWEISFNKPASITRITGWGNYVLNVTGNTASFANESWNGNLGAGKFLKLGFGGVGSLTAGDLATNCQIKINAGPTEPCTVIPTDASGTSSQTSTTFTPTSTPTPAPTPSSAGTSSGGTGSEPTTVAASVHADQTGRVYVGYYPSWSDNWFSAKDWAGNALTRDQILAASKMARIPGTYTHVLVAFAQPNFSYGTATNFDTNQWSGTGLNFNAGPQDIKRAIEVLHARNMKVILAVGGATYNNWGGLSAEAGNPNGVITNALKQLMLDVGFDGLDVDYEVPGITTTAYVGAVKAMRMAVDLANQQDGGSRILAVAGWSTGADCTAATGTSACGGSTSYWGGKAGGERLLMQALEQELGVAGSGVFDMVNIMSYDARYENYDGVRAYALYRGLFPSSTIVNIGLETAPEGWTGGKLVVEDADAQCTGSMILKDQFGNTVNQPYSVHRYASAVTAGHANANPRDGAMLWQVLKEATDRCGTATVASPGTIGNKLSNLYGLPADPRSAWP